MVKLKTCRENKSCWCSYSKISPSCCRFAASFLHATLAILLAANDAWFELKCASSDIQSNPVFRVRTELSSRLDSIRLDWCIATWWHMINLQSSDYFSFHNSKISQKQNIFLIKNFPQTSLLLETWLVDGVAVPFH